MTRNMYLVISLVVLFIIGGILMVSRNNQNTLDTSLTPTMNPTGETPTTEQISETPTITPSETTMKINLDPVDTVKFNQSGNALLSEENGKVTVTLLLNSLNSLSNPQPAHIHKGSCPGVGEVLYPLSNAVNGKSETIIDTTLSNLKNQLPLAINVHKSATESSVYTACGDLK